MSDEINYDLYILNESNIYITREYIEKTLSDYGITYQIKNLELYQKAMIHKSYMKRDSEYWSTQRSNKTNKDFEPIKNPDDAIPLMEKSYERLEFLGDAVLHLILASYIYNRYNTEDEGFMTRLRTKIENGKTLCQLCKIIGLERYILISRFIEKNNGRMSNDDILEDALEAFFGALYSDAGFEICEKFFVKLIEDNIDLAKILHKETNYKDLLLQFFHKQRWEDPTYGVLAITGPDNRKIFTVFVKKRITKTDDGKIIANGYGSSKKNGEQDAAKKALINMGIIKDETEGYDTDSVEELSDIEDDI
jgi:dsRNA-specific ribonuclease